MTNLTKAHDELFRRSPDETFPTMQALSDHCYRLREQSQDRWHAPSVLSTKADHGALVLTLGSDGAFALNDWSFGQLCRLADVSKDTVNRLSPLTASTVLAETLPKGNKPFQILTEDTRIRSLHGATYTRLWNMDLLSMIREFATDFEPPQQGSNGGTGLYAGEQDLFVFLIDPLGWVEIEGENYAPGFFVWNSEVGRRALGCQTFWFEAVCQNHIVWDATDVSAEYTRKHTARVNEGLTEIRAMIEAIVAKRDARKDGFVTLVRKAMEEKLGDDAEEAFKELTKNGIPRSVAKEAVTLAQEKGRFTIWSVVDALTRLSQKSQYAGDRTEADQKAAQLLSLVA